MLPLAGFVGGIIALQQFAVLPSGACTAACALCALLLGLAAVLLRRERTLALANWQAALLLAAGAGFGFSYASLAAHARMADEFSFTDEGRELRVRGVVASLPVRSDDGVRFVLLVEPALDAPVHVPRCIALSWYDSGPFPRGPRQSAPANARPSARLDTRPSSGLDTRPDTRLDTPLDTPLDTRPDAIRASRRTLPSSGPSAFSVLPAQRWEFTVRLRRPQATFNPAGFDGEAWMLEQGIRAIGSVRTGARAAPPRMLDARVWMWGPMIDRARAVLRDKLLDRLQGRRYAGVVVALVVGDQSGIPEDDWTLFNRTGISHLVSISGLHITMIAALAALTVAALWRRSAMLLRAATLPTVRAIAAILGGLAYCLLAGWGVPAQRTLLMLAVVAGAQCLRTRLSSAAILASAAALVCAWDPWAALAAGFWLSFGAVACIFLATSGRVGGAGGWRERLRDGLRIQMAITVGQVPLTLAIFGQVSLIAPIANALAIPLVSYVVAPLALAGSALAMLPDAAGLAGALLLHGGEAVFAFLADALQWLASPAWAASSTWSGWSMPMPPMWTVAGAAMGCAWLLAPSGWPVRWAGVFWLLPLFVWPLARPAPGELWVTALDVGQGMAIVLETAQHAMVFDTGPRYAPEADAGSRVLIPYLRARAIARVDILVISHRDLDHAGGAAALLASIPVAQVWTSMEPGSLLTAAGTASSDSPLGSESLLALRPSAAGVHRCEAGQRIDVPGAGAQADSYAGADAAERLRLTVLSPPAPLYEDARASPNARSCVIMAQVGVNRVLLTGDVPARQERALVRAVEADSGALPGGLSAALLIAPHHGSHTSSSEALVAAVEPRWVSMQLGYRNRFGHPHAEVVQRYRAHGVQVLRSDESGAVQWRFDAAGRAVVERWRIDHARYWHNQPGAPTALMRDDDEEHKQDVDD